MNTDTNTHTPERDAEVAATTDSVAIGSKSVDEPDFTDAVQRGLNDIIEAQARRITGLEHQLASVTACLTAAESERDALRKELDTLR